MLKAVIVSIGTGALALACNANNAGTPPAAGTHVTSAALLPADPIDDAQIFAVLDAAYRGAIAEGRLAIERAADPTVKRFAGEMVEHDTRADGDAVTLAQHVAVVPTQGPMAARMQDQDTRVSADLKTRTGPDFDRAYIADQVTGLRDLLDLIDSRLVPYAKNAALRDELVRTRARVEEQLDEAEIILNGLPKVK